MRQTTRGADKQHAEDHERDRETRDEAASPESLRERDHQCGVMKACKIAAAIATCPTGRRSQPLNCNAGDEKDESIHT